MEGFDHHHGSKWTNMNGRSPAGVRIAHLHRLQDALGDRARFRVRRGRGRDQYHRSQWTVLISITKVNGRL